MDDLGTTGTSGYPLLGWTNPLAEPDSASPGLPGTGGMEYVTGAAGVSRGSALSSASEGPRRA